MLCLMKITQIPHRETVKPCLLPFVFLNMSLWLNTLGRLC
jgi:hypothetical protein